MYKTLRDAGYDPKRAYDATLKGTGIPEPPEKPFDEEEDEEEALLKKMKLRAETEKIQQSIVKGREKKPLKLEERIKEKVAKSGYDSLTPGEMKIYDELT